MLLLLLLNTEGLLRTKISLTCLFILYKLMKKIQRMWWVVDIVKFTVWRHVIALILIFWLIFILFARMWNLIQYICNWYLIIKEGKSLVSKQYL